MNTLPKRLALLCGSTFCFLFVASLATYVIEYKPYGVPDSRRAEYEAMLASLKEQETLVAVLADKAKPKLRLEAKTYDFGLLDPHYMILRFETRATIRFRFEWKARVASAPPEPLARISCCREKQPR
jgi:hypothetical protein